MSIGMWSAAHVAVGNGGVGVHRDLVGVHLLHGRRHLHLRMCQRLSPSCPYANLRSLDACVAAGIADGPEHLRTHRGTCAQLAPDAERVGFGAQPHEVVLAQPHALEAKPAREPRRCDLRLRGGRRAALACTPTRLDRVPESGSTRSRLQRSCKGLWRMDPKSRAMPLSPTT